MVNKQETYDHEKVSFHVARLKKGGENFEVSVDPDMAVAFKEGRNVDMKDIVKSEHIFNDVDKGTLASEHHMKTMFNTTNAVEIAKKIVSEGVIQLSQQYREKIRVEKRNRMISIIVQEGIDPRTKLPHPRTRIENAFEEAKIKVDEFKKAEDQIETVVKKLQPILPIRFEKKAVEIVIGPKYAAKCSGVIRQYSKVLNEEWQNDGSMKCKVEVSAGLEVELYDKLNSMTHGSITTKVID